MARPADTALTAPGAPWLKGAFLLAGLVAAGFTARSLGTGVLSGAAPTWRGAAILVLAGGLLTAAGVPRQVVAFAGGYAFGAWRGSGLALLAQLLGCAGDFFWARAFARDWAVRRLRGRLAAAQRRLVARPFTTTLTLRLLPVGNNLLLNLAAGAAGLKATPFLLASLAGYLPQTAIFALAGSGVHLDHTVQLGVGAALFAASAVLGVVLLRAAPR